MEDYPDIQWAKKMLGDIPKAPPKNPYVQSVVVKKVGTGGEGKRKLVNKISSAFNKIMGVTSCKRVYEFIHTKTREKLYVLVYCESWYCPECGGKDGRYHKTRKERQMKK